jgi:hypothetical protein
MRFLRAIPALVLAGCAATPFTADGVAKALEVAQPIVREFAQPARTASASAEQPVILVLVFPNIARSIWPFSEVRLGTTEQYVILVPGSREVFDDP